jgi:phage RecT family recombinase
MSNDLSRATAAPLSSYARFAQNLATYQKGIGSLVKPEVASRLLRLILVEGALNPAILEATPQSIMRAVFLSAQLQLEPGAVKGELYFIPRKSRIKVGNQWQDGPTELGCQIGYKGYLTLARRSGLITMVDAHVVFAGDDYDLRLGTDPTMNHVPKPGIDRTKTEDIIAAYAVVRLRDGSTYFEWLWRDEIESRRGRSDAAKAFDQGKIKNTPWATDYAAMARKTAIRALFTSGRVPMADQLGFAAAVMDDEAAPAMHQAALAAMASEMAAEGKDTTILGTSEPVEEEAPRNPPEDRTTECGRLELEAGPEQVAIIRKKLHIPLDVSADKIPPGFLEAYKKELLAVAPPV